MPSPSRRVAVIGAGAAGLLAAIAAARRARPSGDEVVVLERTRDGGRKILVSGGGRCNVLPSALQPERFVTDSSQNTLRNMLRAWPLEGQKRFFEDDVGLRLVLEEETGKFFPDTHHAKDVRDALVARAREDGARFVFGARAVDVVADAGGWRIHFEDGPPLDADAVIVATGGLSVPRTGSDGFGLDLARRTGHRIVPPYPALTPLLGGDDTHHDLSGVSATVTLSAGTGRRRRAHRGGFLFTHRGFSGPTVLDVSHHVARGDDVPLRVCWVDEDEDAFDVFLRTDGPRSVLGALRAHLPERLAACLAAGAGVDPGGRLAELRRSQRRALVDALVRWPLPADGHEGYRKAEVTGGGIHLAEVDPRTLESRRCPGLYFCGEVLDAFGPIGGHNFAWAWSTGKTAGENA